MSDSIRFKVKYHDNIARSSEYAAIEDEAVGKLKRHIGKFVLVEESGKGVGQQGVIPDISVSEFDVTLRHPISKRVIGFVEITSDRKKDEFARIRVGKFFKAVKQRKLVIFFYYKKPRHAWFWITAKFALTLLHLKKAWIARWLNDEKPYVWIPLKYFQPLNTLSKFIEDFTTGYRRGVMDEEEYVKCVELNINNPEKCIKTWVI